MSESDPREAEGASASLEHQGTQMPTESAKATRGIHKPTSLRWRLQLWHASILTTVVVLFGTVLAMQMRRATLVEVDAELLSGARVIEGALRTVRPTSMATDIAALPLDFPAETLRLHGHGGPPGPPPHERGPERVGGAPAGGAPPSFYSRPPQPDGPIDHGPLDGPPERGPAGQRRPQPPYFAIFADGGQLLRTNATVRDPSFRTPQGALSYRVVDNHREVLLRGPLDTVIIVGRDVRPMMSRLFESLVQLIVCGVAVLCLGLVGGWWLAGRAIGPIAEISRTAAQVSASSLAARVDTQAMDQELQSLGETLNAMLERLETSFQQQTQFTADASHELRTPLAVLMSHCELALSRPRSPEDYIATLGICRSAAERMQHLVSGLMTLARADAGKLELQCVEADLHSLAADGIRMLEPLAKQRDISLKLEGQSAACFIDIERMLQVVVNLLQNAIQYSPSGVQITVSTESLDDGVRLCVSDPGTGIPPAAIPRLFDRFYRVDTSRSRGPHSSQGTGLGLAICKSIVDAHGGSIQVTSQLGTGSQFEVKLPTPESRERLGVSRDT